MIARGFPAFGQRHPPVDPNQLARRILAHGGFHLHSRPQGVSIWSRIFGWLDSLLNRIFGPLHAPPHGVQQLLGFIAVAGAAALVVYAVVRLMLAISSENASHVTASSSRALQTRQAAKVWYDRAVAAAQAGQFRAAAVLLFRAVVTILDLRGFVHDRPSRTVDECSRELRLRAPQYLNDFLAVARAFTAALYAETPVGQTDWEQARSAYERLTAAVTNAS